MIIDIAGARGDSGKRGFSSHNKIIDKKSQQTSTRKN